MSERKMRAKVRVGSIVKHGESEQITFHGVANSSAYPDDGTDENNSFAKFSPSVQFVMTIANPALVGTFEVGNTFYYDFTPAPA